MSTANVGDTVRISLEGEVTRLDDKYLYVKQANGHVFGLYRPHLAAKVEVLIPAEPEWQEGDVVLVESSGLRYAVLLRSDGWVSQACKWSAEDISRKWRRGQLTLISRDGVPL